MAIYKHILLAADFFEKNTAVVEKAKELAHSCDAKLSIIHVVDTLPITDPANELMMPFDMDVTKEFIAAAKTKLSALSEKLGIAEPDSHLKVGSPKVEITQLAEEINADLIVIGSHGRHGLALLLGSTANGVLHHATCDVLAVRLQPN
ncbi:MAG: universal stress protein [Gammaproteobacteria bacterium]